MRVRSHVLYGKYLVQDLDLNIYKRTTATIKSNNLHVQLFSGGRSHSSASFLTRTALLMADVCQQREFFIRTV